MATIPADQLSPEDNAPNSSANSNIKLQHHDLLRLQVRQGVRDRDILQTSLQALPNDQHTNHVWVLLCLG